MVSQPARIGQLRCRADQHPRVWPPTLGYHLAQLQSGKLKRLRLHHGFGRLDVLRHDLARLCRIFLDKALYIFEGCNPGLDRREMGNALLSRLCITAAIGMEPSQQQAISCGFERVLTSWPIAEMPRFSSDFQPIPRASEFPRQLPNIHPLPGISG